MNHLDDNTRGQYTQHLVKPEVQNFCFSGTKGFCDISLSHILLTYLLIHDLADSEPLSYCVLCTVVTPAKAGAFQLGELFN